MDNYKILIIDDQAENLKVMVAIIEEFHPNYEIFQTLFSSKALDIALKVKPDIVITDWEMPEISGIELIELFKKNVEIADVPIIMATGIRLTAFDLKTALDVGASDFIAKPIDPMEFVSRIKSALTLRAFHKELLLQKDEALTESSLRLLKGHEFNISFANKIENLKSLVLKNPLKAIEHLDQLKQQLKEEVDQDGWYRFNLSFSKVHKNFNKNLIDTHPNLTPTDIKLCSFIKLGMSNKEIASVLHQGSDSVKVSRYRVRKKMGLEGSLNLESYISKF